MEEKTRARVVSQKAMLKIMEFEGFRAEAYQCPGGVWTVGYGHTKGVTSCTKCTMDQAKSWLADDIQQAEKIVSDAVAVELTQGQFDALTDFVFNVGGSLLRTSTLLKKINELASTYEIQKEFKRWVYAGGKMVKGLVKRREWECKRWEE